MGERASKDSHSPYTSVYFLDAIRMNSGSTEMQVGRVTKTRLHSSTPLSLHNEKMVKTTTVKGGGVSTIEEPLTVYLQQGHFISTQTTHFFFFFFFELQDRVSLCTKLASNSEMYLPLPPLSGCKEQLKSCTKQFYLRS